MPNLIASPTEKSPKYLSPVTMPGRDANATLTLLGLHPMGVCAEYPDFVSIVVRSPISASVRKLSTLFGQHQKIVDQECFWNIPGCGKVFLRSTSKPRTCVVSFNKSFYTTPQ